jgi:signal transduction histidine kinase
VAELSSSLAHEIKNPLASIRSSVEQLSRSTRANPDERFLGTLIVRESDRLSRLLSEFLDFSRVRVTQCRPVDLQQVARAAVRLVREHPDCPEDAVIDLEGGACCIGWFRIWSSTPSRRRAKVCASPCARIGRRPRSSPGVPASRTPWRSG